MSKQLGRQSKYEEIVQATYGSVPDDEPASEDNAVLIDGNDMSRMSSPNTSEDGERKTVSKYLWKNVACSIIMILLVIIFALAGGRASSRGESADLVEDKVTATAIKWRPCQIYLDPSETSVQVLQTSLGDPSNQWGQVPCLVRNTKRTPYSQIYDDPQWSWLFGINEEGTKQPLDYGMPSAVIRAEFDKLAHPNRKPILGFGGAFTEASALNYMSLEKDGRAAILELLFGKDGLGYSLGRVPINSCDFSVESYSFDDVVDDFTLESFDMTVEHDVMSGMVELMLQADSTLKDAWPGDSLNVMASPWSPPAWMKKPTWRDPVGATHAVNMTGSAEPNCLREGTGPESPYAKSWALYFSKFLSACKSTRNNIFEYYRSHQPFQFTNF